MNQENEMTLQEQIAADQVALQAAQDQLAKDQAALDAITPHLGVVAEIEAELVKLEASAAAAITPLVAKLKGLFRVA
jgi:hypothetical protein